MTLNVVMSFVVLLVFIVGAYLAARAFMWLVFRIAASTPQIGRKHRHEQWGRDLSRKKDEPSRQERV